MDYNDQNRQTVVGAFGPSDNRCGTGETYLSTAHSRAPYLPAEAAVPTCRYFRIKDANDGGTAICHNMGDGHGHSDTFARLCGGCASQIVGQNRPCGGCGARITFDEIMLLRVCVRAIGGRHGHVSKSVAADSRIVCWSVRDNIH